MCYIDRMKYSLAAQSRDGTDVASGHLTASSALAGVGLLKDQGACRIQIFDIKTGRLMDEAALLRADTEARMMARLRPAGA